MMWSYKYLLVVILGYIIILIIFLMCYGFELIIFYINDVYVRVQEMDKFGGQCFFDKDCFGGVVRMRIKIEVF